MLEIGETIRHGVAREVKEETGYDIRVGDVIATVDMITPDEQGRILYHFVLIDLLAVWVSGEGVPSDEVRAMAWASMDQLHTYNLWDETERVIRLSADTMQQGPGMIDETI
ncbi:MAG: hypothetical protein NVS4B8_00130 [Herpetosiphon sp.]